MSELAEDIVGLVEDLILPLIDNPDDFEISASETDSEIIVEMTVNEEDAGKVIGRQGRVIKAVRTIARAAASREGVHVEVELND